MNICIFGDSIAWGIHDPRHGGWVQCLRNHFEARNNDINVYNLGIAGDTTTDVLARINVEAKSRNPDIIVFAIGINDAQHIRSARTLRVSLHEFRTNLAQCIAIAKTFTDNIAFVGLTRVDESKTTPVPWNAAKFYTNAHIEQFEDTIERLCTDNRLQFISMKNIVGNDDLFDGLHPNTNGHAKMFERVVSELRYNQNRLA